MDWRLQKSNAEFSGASYGHMGCCSLLVIQRVAELSAERTAIPEATQYSCTTRSWKRSKKSFPTDASPNPPSGGSLGTKPYDAGEAALKWYATNQGIVPPDQEPDIHEDVSRPLWPRAAGDWTSSDRTRTFSIELRMKGELNPQVDVSIRGDWVAYKMSAKVCASLN